MTKLTTTAFGASRTPEQERHVVPVMVSSLPLTNPRRNPNPLIFSAKPDLNVIGLCRSLGEHRLLHLVRLQRTEKQCISQCLFQLYLEGGHLCHGSCGMWKLGQVYWID